MKDTYHEPRSRFFTVLVVVAPSAILVVGLWLMCMTAFSLSELPFEPNWIIMVVGIVIVVTIALVTVIFADRPKETSKILGQQPPDP